MPSNLKFLNPETIAPPPRNGFTHVVELSGPGRMVFVAGQLGLRPDGSMAGGAGDFRAQAAQAYENLKAALAAVGGRLDHVVKTTNFLVGIEHLPVFREVRDQNFKGTPPASTTLAVVALARPDALFEVEAVALLPPR
jgi:enamine deaminase RidA (YjgF/YER057c/UK114 family)